MAIKTYGKIIFKEDQFVITEAQPHVSIKLKAIFAKIHKASIPPYSFKGTPEFCADLLWFMERYPLNIDTECKNKLIAGKEKFVNTINELEAIHMPNYRPVQLSLKEGFKARHYQLTANETFAKVKRMLLGDDLGLGKTLTSILSLLRPEARPAAVVVQTHLPDQWKDEGIEKFTDLKVHIIKKTTPYNLPPADVYIFKYSSLFGWGTIFETGFFKTAIFDECQELRTGNASLKYMTAVHLSNNAEYVMGLSATPIYNYGDEIFNIMELIKPGCLGHYEAFIREWGKPTGRHTLISDPAALGTYLRENFLFLRRTKKDVHMELSPVNKIIHTVDYDQEEVDKSESLAISLAMRVMNGSFVERGQAAREFDMLMRQITGVSKARHVAEYVRILLENNIPVLLAGWHREVYEIWLEHLAEFKPVMYTGSESGKRKNAAKKSFINGETKLMIISLRSGAGMDGLQKVCSDVVIGELDWSPKVHEQLIGRLDRPGQENQVTAHILISDEGSDPVIVNMLGLKDSQSFGIVDPLESVPQQYSDESRIKLLAKEYLKKYSTTENIK